MRNLFGHPLAKGLLQPGMLVAWGCGGMRWFFEHYVGRPVPRGVALSAMLPAALALGAGGTTAMRVTPQLPAVAVAVAEGVAHRLRRERGAT